MASSKPIIWIHAFSNTDPDYGLLPQFEPMVREHFDIITYADVANDNKMAESACGAFIFAPQLKMFTEQFPLMKNLKVIGNFGVGYNHLDIKGLSAKGIKVSNTPDVLSNATADMGMALLLASARNLYSGAKKAMEDPNCKRFDLNTLGFEVTGASIGIVGMGSIGFRVAKRARGFDMKILYHNRNQRSASDEAELGGATYYRTLHAMLPHSDFVVVCCPLTEETTNLFGEKEFELMHKNSTIINIARGQIIDQDALYKALKEKRIRAAALDVTVPEPLPRDHPLLTLDNIIITPHFGSATEVARRGMCETVVRNLKAGLIDNAPLPNEVKL